MEPSTTRMGATLLRKMRKMRGWNTKELLKEMGYPVRNSNIISQMEYGSRPIFELWARRFGEVFGIPWREFVK